MLSTYRKRNTILLNHKTYIRYRENDKGVCETESVSLLELIWEGVARRGIDYNAEIHGGHFDNVCKRYSYYKLKNPNVFGTVTREAALRFWIGNAIHDRRILPLDEKLPPNKFVEYKGVKFTPDEYYSGILLEKKTVRGWNKLPATPRKPSIPHASRCEHYNMALVRNNIPVNVVGLLYIDYFNEKFYLFSTEQKTLKLRSVEDTETTFDILYADLMASLAKDVPPAREISWLCDYCSAFAECFKEVGRN